jgi:N-acetylglucosaminyl-diphospho-decaprenol L-rhamnosyltransferase
MTRVRIGIVSWNTAELLDRCLAAIPEAAIGLDFDVVVVDNASSDGSAEVALRHADVTVEVNRSNVGYARGMNQALRLRTGGLVPEVLIALNPDTVPPPGSLASLVGCLMSDPTLGMVVPQLTNMDGSLQHSVYRFPSPLLTLIICMVPVRLQRGRLARRWWLEGRVPHDRACDVDWGIGAVHVIRAGALGRQDPYCERWFMYAEDMDLCWRLGQDGWRCRLTPNVQVPHVGNASGRQAWGGERSQRWWEASYDWYRFRRGVPAVRRWAAVNTIGVAKLLATSRLRRWLTRQNSVNSQARDAELSQALPTHRAMWREPSTAFLPPKNEELEDH